MRPIIGLGVLRRFRAVGFDFGARAVLFFD